MQTKLEVARTEKTLRFSKEARALVSAEATAMANGMDKVSHAMKFR